MGEFRVVLILLFVFIAVREYGVKAIETNPNFGDTCSPCCNLGFCTRSCPPTCRCVDVRNSCPLWCKKCDCTTGDSNSKQCVCKDTYNYSPPNCPASDVSVKGFESQLNLK
ncbi:Bowman-Birk type proteinase inhibitor-like [Amborella trichopoda]|uniref:Bowman-Birk type proteinase inhibitor-like n=1 Tax=Amborella trichopoda TaxID=13333 RepID=UPI0005D319FC|nr:Bowman-Birk type proteinase inhibitor-like [Amborella trichopoda]|eukprot:XP_011621070.1 Bowman-Birk type proteinase inhibitor-like [Amborella trichopoda]